MVNRQRNYTYFHLLCELDVPQRIRGYSIINRLAFPPSSNFSVLHGKTFSQNTPSLSDATVYNVAFFFQRRTGRILVSSA